MYTIRGPERHYFVDGLVFVGGEDCEGGFVHCGLGIWGGW